MPLFYQHNINRDTSLGIWQIQEDESFFLERVPSTREVSHPRKRLQHLAGRWLLPTLCPDFPLTEILIADTRKPFLPAAKYHFSISHCANFAAAIVSPVNRVGIDLEVISEKTDLISHKFLSESERDFLHRQRYLENARSFISAGFMDISPETILHSIAWSAKESVFKWYGLGSVDFRQHIQLQSSLELTEQQEWILPVMFTRQEDIWLEVHARIFNNLVLAWVVT